MADKIRVLLVDDQELIRYGFRLVLEAEPDMVVVGEASDGDQAVRAVRNLKPDVVLMDVRMPGLGGVEATQHVTDFFPNTRVIVLTTYDRDEFAFGALSAGAAGFLLKNTRPAELVAAIRAVNSGDAAVSPRVTAKLIEFAVPHLGKKPAPEPEKELAALSDRERDVFLLIGQGYTNAEIAHALNLSESTIKTHFGRVLFKLGLSSRVQAVIRAYELGIAGNDAASR